MSLLSVRLSRALERGRAPRASVQTRAELLRVLLHKRAAAYNAGADELEELLRSQILWALPVERFDGGNARPSPAPSRQLRSWSN